MPTPVVTLTPLDFQRLLKFHDITWEVGPEESRDAKGSPYVTLDIGGVKHEGAPSVTFPEERERDMLLTFERTFLAWLDGRKHVHVRLWPSTVLYEESLWENGVAHATRKAMSIRGRFTAY